MYTAAMQSETAMDVQLLLADYAPQRLPLSLGVHRAKLELCRRNRSVSVRQSRLCVCHSDASPHKVPASRTHAVIYIRRCLWRPVACSTCRACYIRIFGLTHRGAMAVCQETANAFLDKQLLSAVNMVNMDREMEYRQVMV